MRIGRPTEALPVITPRELDERAASTERPQGARQGPSFSAVLSGMGRELDDGEALTARALRGASAGGGLSAGALIALQAGIYRYVEVVDLATKLVDRATSAVKTTLQSQ